MKERSGKLDHSNSVLLCIEPDSNDGVVDLHPSTPWLPSGLRPKMSVDFTIQRIVMSV